MGPPCEFGRCGRTTARFLGMLLLLLGLSGCASMITSTYPAQERVEEGQVTVGPIVGHDFELQHVDGNRFKLFKTPLCRELVEKKRITKKQTRGVYAAMAEVPFFGLGLVDWVWADALSENSQETRVLGREPTGRSVVCGDRVVAAHERLVLQFPVQGSFEGLQVDGQGHVDLSPALHRHPHFSSVNVFVNVHPGLKYLTTLFR